MRSAHARQMLCDPLQTETDTIALLVLGLLHGARRRRQDSVDGIVIWQADRLDWGYVCEQLPAGGAEGIAADPASARGTSQAARILPAGVSAPYASWIFSIAVPFARSESSSRATRPGTSSDGLLTPPAATGGVPAALSPFAARAAAMTGAPKCTSAS